MALTCETNAEKAPTAPTEREAYRSPCAAPARILPPAWTDTVDVVQRSEASGARVRARGDCHNKFVVER